MADFELGDDGVYRNTRIFEELLKFTKLEWGNNIAILKELEKLVDNDFTGWFTEDINGEIYVGIELNESSDHKYDEIIFYDKNRDDITVFSVMREEA
ncbi:hypothetical protein MSHOH_2222 [Methanosarcina horonobensis HB-1 = JCM 15518]|uniref:Uncharacterized protein n=1 Tax=Methanosarcina horonobensis HB-1 = JCM 15518 TaxID=1434110 RepID=A0A0E3WUD8_9EURY|nr:hypothetical protein [Methanosarcina horonobensis]AKB78705.1 hypothetical protein MSHOH_2222 [Methanosarcina horonobensis HB-1 = JCM 15518]